MSNVDAIAARLRRLLHWAAFVGCAAAAVAIGLLTDEAFLYAAAEPETAAPIAHIEQVATAEPAYLGFAASPVTETNAQFFFGSGDGSDGYYAERPAVDRKVGLVRFERMP
jgi:hypothetical protein